MWMSYLFHTKKIHLKITLISDDKESVLKANQSAKLLHLHGLLDLVQKYFGVLQSLWLLCYTETPKNIVMLVVVSGEATYLKLSVRKQRCAPR